MLCQASHSQSALMPNSKTGNRAGRQQKGYGVDHEEQQRSGHDHGKRIGHNIPHGGSNELWWR